MAYIMTTEAEIVQKAGAGKSATFDTAMMTAANLRAESTINTVARYNYSDAVTAGLNVDVKGILSDIASSMVAIEAVSYDMSGYESRTEAEDIINVQHEIVQRGLSIIKDKEVQGFINDA